MNDDWTDNRIRHAAGGDEMQHEIESAHTPVDFLLPTCGCRATTERMLDSIYRFNDPALFRLLICDAVWSRLDGTREVIRRFEETHGNIVVEYASCAYGGSVSRNRMMRHVRSEIFGCLDSDIEFLAPDAIADALALMSDPQVVAVGNAEQWQADCVGGWFRVSLPRLRPDFCLMRRSFMERFGLTLDPFWYQLTMDTPAPRWMNPESCNRFVWWSDCNWQVLTTLLLCPDAKEFTFVPFSDSIRERVKHYGGTTREWIDSFGGHGQHKVIYESPVGGTCNGWVVSADALTEDPVPVHSFDNGPPELIPRAQIIANETIWKYK